MRILLQLINGGKLDSLIDEWISKFIAKHMSIDGDPENLQIVLSILVEF